MAVTMDYVDLVRLITDHPEWRPELRRLILTDEILELPRIVAELAEAQRRTEARVEELAQAQRRTEARVEELAEAQRRTEARVAELAEAQRRTEARVEELAQAQRRTEERLVRLEEVVKKLADSHERLVDTVAAMKGDLLELRYLHRVGSYFGSLLRKARPVEWHTLDDVLHDRLSPAEFRDVLSLDLLVSGSLRGEPEPPLLFVATEVSSVVDAKDVSRASRRARLLRKAGYCAVPAVAGDSITQGAKSLAEKEKVAILQDGSEVLWEEALAAWGAAVAPTEPNV